MHGLAASGLRRSVLVGTVLVAPLAIVWCSHDAPRSKPDDPPCSARLDPSTPGVYEVCVVDESRRPLAGVNVTAYYTRYWGSGPAPEWAGAERTDRSGLARIRFFPDNHRSRDHFSAFGERAGWPIAEDVDGTIVLGPPRTVRGQLRAPTTCDHRETHVYATPVWRTIPTGSVPSRPQLEASVDVDGSFELHDVGPGRYDVQASAWACNRAGYTRGVELATQPVEIVLEALSK
jgi:hypothetical protein